MSASIGPSFMPYQFDPIKNVTNMDEAKLFYPKRILF